MFTPEGLKWKLCTKLTGNPVFGAQGSCGKELLARDERARAILTAELLVWAQPQFPQNPCLNPTSRAQSPHRWYQVPFDLLQGLGFVAKTGLSTSMAARYLFPWEQSLYLALQPKLQRRTKESFTEILKRGSLGISLFHNKSCKLKPTFCLTTSLSGKPVSPLSLCVSQLLGLECSKKYLALSITGKEKC